MTRLDRSSSTTSLPFSVRNEVCRKHHTYYLMLGARHHLKVNNEKFPTSHGKAIQLFHHAYEGSICERTFDRKHRMSPSHTKKQALDLKH